MFPLASFLTAKAGLRHDLRAIIASRFYRCGGEKFAPDAVVFSPAEHPQASSCIALE
jgi:hypothetical protein